MPDVTPDVSDARQSTATTAGGEPDPFLSLHKMSTTAGLGSGDYVAINGTSIAALLLGIVSALVLFGAWLLLLIPLAGIVCGVLALRQISDSNGTQTGKGLAWIGLLWSLVFAGIFIGKESIETVRSISDSEQVDAVLKKFEGDIKGDKYDDAYQNLCDDHFKGRVPQAPFVNLWKIYNGRPMLGRITSIHSKLLKFDNDPVTDERLGSGLVLIDFEKVKGEDRQGMVFRKVNDQWLIDDMPNLFQQPAQGQQGGGGGGAGAPQKSTTVVPSGPAGPPAPQGK
jgi:hypothetical protein